MKKPSGLRSALDTNDWSSSYDASHVVVRHLRRTGGELPRGSPGRRTRRPRRLPSLPTEATSNDPRIGTATPNEGGQRVRSAPGRRSMTPGQSTPPLGARGSTTSDRRLESSVQSVRTHSSSPSRSVETLESAQPTRRAIRALIALHPPIVEPGRRLERSPRRPNLACE